jgi:hypothetical protein
LYGILGAFLLACADGWVFAEKTGSEDRGKVLLSYSAFEQESENPADMS